MAKIIAPRFCSLLQPLQYVRTILAPIKSRRLGKPTVQNHRQPDQRLKIKLGPFRHHAVEYLAAVLPPRAIKTGHSLNNLLIMCDCQGLRTILAPIKSRRLGKPTVQNHRQPDQRLKIKLGPFRHHAVEYLAAVLLPRAIKTGHSLNNLLIMCGFLTPKSAAARGFGRPDPGVTNTSTKWGIRYGVYEEL